MDLGQARSESCLPGVPLAPSGLKCCVPVYQASLPLQECGNRAGRVTWEKEGIFCRFQKPRGLWREIRCSRVAQTSVVSVRLPRFLLCLFLLNLDPRASLSPSSPLPPPSPCLPSPTRNGHPVPLEWSGSQPSPDQGRVQGRTEAHPWNLSSPAGADSGKGDSGGVPRLANECSEAALPACPDPRAGGASCQAGGPALE